MNFDMGLNFYVGQKIVCVDAPVIDGFGIPCPAVNGRVYTIMGLHEASDEPPHLRFGLTLYEIVPPAPYRGFVRWMFRPAVERKTDISIFQKMLTDERVTV